MRIYLKKQSIDFSYYYDMYLRLSDGEKYNALLISIIEVPPLDSDREETKS